MLRMSWRSVPRVVRPAVAIAGLLFAHGASAGGYDTGEQDWDFLFQQSHVAAEAGVRFVDPQRTLKNIAFTWIPMMTASAREAAPFAIERASVSAGLGGYNRCMASYRQPWAGHADYGATWGVPGSAMTQDFTSDDLGLTCAAGLAAGPGMIELVGGLSWQQVRYKLVQSLAPGVTRTTDVGDSGLGWRAGVAYEIPQYALRASLIYNSAVAYDLTGSLAMTGVPVATPIFGSITMPQSLELKAQSGIAPGWLAFGAIKWTNWSVDKNTPLCQVGVPTCTQAVAQSGLALGWHDSWTVTLGAAHPFSETFALAPAITWDQGASGGFTSQTDTWTATLTGVFTPNKNTEIKLGGTAGIMTAGTVNTSFLPDGSLNPVGYTASFGNDMVYALNASAKVQF